MQLSVRSLLFVCAYAAICTLTYTNINLWVGTAIVIATIVLLIYSTVYAFKSRRLFPLGFSLAAFAWMTFWLGFYAETSPKILPWSLPHGVFLLMGGRGFDSDKVDLNTNPSTYATMHSIHVSSHMGTWGLPLQAPAFHNAIRLAVCLTALGFGLCLGTVVHFIHRLCAKRDPVSD